MNYDKISEDINQYIAKEIEKRCKEWLENAIGVDFVNKYSELSEKYNSAADKIIAQAEAIRILRTALERLKQHSFDKLNQNTPMPVDASEIVMVNIALDSVESILGLK